MNSAGSKQQNYVKYEPLLENDNAEKCLFNAGESSVIWIAVNVIIEILHFSNFWNF